MTATNSASLLLTVTLTAIDFLKRAFVKGWLVDWCKYFQRCAIWQLSFEAANVRGFVCGSLCGGVGRELIDDARSS